MNKREVGLAIALIVVILAGLGYYRVEARKWEAAEKERKELVAEKERLESEAADLQARAEKLREEADRLNETLNEKVKVISKLRARTRPRSVSITGSEACRRCARENALPVRVTDDQEWVEVLVRDAFHPEDGATIEFLPAFTRDFITPREEALAECNGTLKDCLDALDRATARRGVKPGKFVSIDTSHTVFAGVGYLPSGNIGYGAHYSARFLRIGSPDSFHANAGVDAGGYANLSGEDVQPFIMTGVNLRW